MGVRSSLKNGRDFLARQSHNYRMMIVRSGGGMFLFNLTGQYSSIFTKALGADNMTIAWLSSVSSFISMIISMPVGYVTDNYNLKKVMGAGLFLNIAMIGMYAFAQDWRWIFVAMVINPFTMALMFRSQQVIITNELDSAERARGMGIRMQIAMILGLISPIPAAYLVNRWGGLTSEGIRPLYYIRFVGMIIVYSYVYIKLTDVLPRPRAKKSTGFINDFKEVLDEGGRKLKVMMVVQYKVREPGLYLFETEEPDWLVERAVESAMSRFIARLPVDDVLTTAKAEIEIRSVERAQELLDEYGAGISLLTGNLQVVSPPVPVIEAFNDVARAKKDSERTVEHAHVYENQIVPQAEGEAQTVVNEAAGAYELRVNRAQGEAERFKAVLGEYERDRELTRRRLYLEAMERVLAKTKVVIVNDSSTVTIIER